nr:MAG TPA: hypothetical protein [Bacteriophage sp.]
MSEISPFISQSNSEISSVLEPVPKPKKGYHFPLTLPSVPFELL